MTFEVTGQPDKWVQFVDGTVNAAYPRLDRPALDHLLPFTAADPPPTLVDWEPGSYATFEVPDLDHRGIARWIDRYFVRVLQCEEDGYHVDVSIGEQL